MKPGKLQCHNKTKHPGLSDKPLKFFHWNKVSEWQSQEEVRKQTANSSVDAKATLGTYCLELCPANIGKPTTLVKP